MANATTGMAVRTFNLGLMLLALMATTQAQARPDHHRDERVAQGVRSGQLTARETRAIASDARALRTERRAYRADGVVTPVERRDLRRDGAQLDRQIYNQKHDAQVQRMATPVVRERQENQIGRIGQGVRSGELTRSETRELAAEQRSIQQEKRAYRADGVVDAAERRDLRQDTREASRNIYMEKHDDERRQ